MEERQLSEQECTANLVSGSGISAIIVMNHIHFPQMTMKVCYVFH